MECRAGRIKRVAAPVRAIPEDPRQGGNAGREAILSRIARAKQYKQESTSSNATSVESGFSGSVEGQPAQQMPPVPPTPSLPQPALEQPNMPPFVPPAAPAAQLPEAVSGTAVSPQGSDSSRARNAPARPGFYAAADMPATQELLASAPTRSDGGSATQAASWLQGVLSEQTSELSSGLDAASMRPEEFTLAKEARMRSQGADIITAAPSTFPADTSGSSGSDASADGVERYKPKVTTWGVFPRPTDISKAYGGGRNIQPGQELETAEQRAKRQAEFAAAMLQYKKRAGLTELSPADVAAAEEVYGRGMEQFGAGRLQEALVLFNEARGMVPLKARVGGLSTLQAAICLDTLGSASEAQALYSKCRGHPVGEVSRKARQLSFGFQAMDFLKAKTISYAVDKKAYDVYFRRFADNRRVYVASEQEREADALSARQAAILALAVLLGPIAMFAAFLSLHAG